MRIVRVQNINTGTIYSAVMLPNTLSRRYRPDDMLIYSEHHEHVTRVVKSPYVGYVILSKEKNG